uniref:Uncharacterized protein n=1 Tax=Rhizophora mucronata TaxID=61149 RepID=A0A2P2QN12_RHIMU
MLFPVYILWQLAGALYYWLMAAGCCLVFHGFVGFGFCFSLPFPPSKIYLDSLVYETFVTIGVTVSSFVNYFHTGSFV